MRVFVYGSLKRGLKLHPLLADSHFLGTAVTRPHYRIFSLGEYPGLVEWPDGLAVCGELYEVNARTLQQLDQAEGTDEGLYARREILLQPPHADEYTEAWFWLGSTSGLTDAGTNWNPNGSDSAG